MCAETDPSAEVIPSSLRDCVRLCSGASSSVMDEILRLEFSER